MALPILSVPAFPDVPALPGVPPLARQAGVQALNSLIGQNPVSELLADVLGLNGSTPEWGIFTSDGAPVITGDSTLSFEFAKNADISDFPIEQGGFASYNKVEKPYDAKLLFATVDRETFLLDIEPQLLGLDLYVVLTPDKSYENANIVHYDYRRTVDNGVSLLSVDVWVREVRVTVESEFTQTKEPEGEATKSNSTVQATPVAPVVAQERALKATGDIKP